MERISAYQSTDGRIFEERATCKAHQAWLDLVLLARTAAPEHRHVAEDVVRALVPERDDALRLLRAAQEAP